MSRLESAALAFVRAKASMHRACDAYRTQIGRDDLDHKTPEERAWWEAHVLPTMRAVWAAERDLDAAVAALDAGPVDEPFGAVAQEGQAS